MEKEYIVAGERRRSERPLPVRCPYDGAVVGRTWLAAEGDVEAAVAAAWERFARGEIPPLHERVAVLEKMAALVRERAAELARTIALEAGKNIKEARGEVDRCAFTCATAAREASRVEGEIVDLGAHAAGKGRLGLVRRFVRGPVLAITPFNFPLNLVAHKLAPALACGAPVVVKPASATPLSALSLAELALEAGAPPAQISVLPLPGVAAQRLVGDDRFGILTFTGSQEVGWGLKAAAGRKVVCLELGGNAAAVVHDADDLGRVAKRVAVTAFGVAGQSCISVQRVYVQRRHYEPFLAALVSYARGYKVGHPLDEEAHIGSMIDEPNAIRIEGWVRQAAARGAEVMGGGRRDGSRFEPTVVTRCPRDADLSAKEAFAPVVVVEPYDDFDDAVAAVNDSRYGLQAGFFVADWGLIRRAWERVRAGAVVVNDVPSFRVDHMPYGGAKESGLGREGPRYAIEEYTEPRMLIIN